MEFNHLDKLASAIRNDIYSGLQGYHTNLSLNVEQLKDDIVDERLQIIKEFALKGTLPYKDLLVTLNCVPVDCKNIEKCRCTSDYGTPTAHFEIPQIVNDFDDLLIDYIGTIDKETEFVLYTSLNNKRLHKYKRRNNVKKPFVWIDVTPNENGMYDGFIFNAPLIKVLSIVAVFKDIRQLEKYECCMLNGENISFLDNEIKKRLTQKKLMYYRQYSAPIRPNDQAYE